MDLLAKVLSRWSDAHLGDGEMSGPCMNTRITFSLLGLGVQLHPCDSPTLNEFVRTGWHNVPQVAVQLHDAEEFNGVGGIGVMDNAIQPARSARDCSDELALQGCYCKLSRADLHFVALGIKCAKRD